MTDIYTVEFDLEKIVAERKAAEALAADAETLLNHREQDNLHSVDYQRLAQTLRQYREATK